MNIKIRLTLLFTLLVTFLTITSDIIGYLGIKKSLHDAAVKEAKDKVEEVQSLVDVLYQEFENKSRFRIRKDFFTYALSYEGNSLYSSVFMQMTINNQIFAVSPNLISRSLPVLPIGEYESLTLVLPRGSLDVLYYSSPIKVEGVQVATIQVALPVVKNQSFLSNLLLFDLAELFLAILISLFLGHFLADKALSPVTHLIKEVKKINTDNVSERVDTTILAKDEIGDLADTFNDMLDKISESVKSQKRFISDASHELRSPLTAIIGHSEILIKRSESNPEIIKKSSEVILRESKRLKNLVNDMLYLSRQQVKISKLDIVKPAQIIREVYYNLQALHPQLYLEISKLAESSFFEGDTESIRRVIINLIDNALKAIEENGLVIVNLSTENNQLKLSVSDNGCGIDKEHINKLFKRFYRVDSDRNSKKGGSGLGLSIVYEILKAHNADIEVQSEIGKGSVFTIVFKYIKNISLKSIVI